MSIGCASSKTLESFFECSILRRSSSSTGGAGGAMAGAVVVCFLRPFPLPFLLLFDLEDLRGLLLFFDWTGFESASPTSFGDKDEICITSKSLIPTCSQFCSQVNSRIMSSNYVNDEISVNVMKLLARLHSC